VLRGLPEINFLGDPSMTLSLFNQYIPNQTCKNMRFWAHSIFIPISEWTYTPSSQRCHHVFGGENSGACRDGCRFCGLTYTQMTFLPVKMWMSLPFLFLAMQIDLLQVQFLVACAYVISLICAAYIYMTIIEHAFKFLFMSVKTILLLVLTSSRIFPHLLHLWVSRHWRSSPFLLWQ